MAYKKGIVFTTLITGFILSLFLCLFYRLDLSNGEIILSYIRVPAVIKAIISGSCLSLAGMFLQTISKNPLADPYLTGLSSGAGFGIVISILFFNSVNYSLFGFFGALFAAALVIILSGFSKFSITKLILIGLSVNLFTGALISFLILLNPLKSYAMTLILTGGFSSADVSNKVLVSLFISAIILCGLFVPKLNAMRLDNRLIFNSDTKVNLYNIVFIILAAFLTSISVYCAGILGFAGIICPLLTKLLLGNDSRILFFANILTGSTLLLFSNFLAANIIYPLEVPLGVVVAIAGVPFFVYFLLKKGGILNNQD